MHWLAVALGGSVGAMCRYWVALSLPYVHGKIPLATLMVNIIGSCLMGAFFVVIVEKGLLPSMWRQVVMVGFLGALTTFSTFSLESLQMLQNGAWKLALGYALGSVVSCVLAAFGGYLILNKLL